jgi:hypothetical protein
MKTQAQIQAGERTQHTPGPWRVDTMRHSAKSEVFVIPGVCVVTGATTEADSEANARLIAAAPELLAVLREIAEHMPVSAPPSQRDIANLQRAVMPRARAAIARAEGRAQ